MPQFRFTSLADFLSMSGHGVYVWSCVAITVVILGFLLLRPLFLHKAQLQKLARQRPLEKPAQQSQP